MTKFNVFMKIMPIENLFEIALSLRKGGNDTKAIAKCEEILREYPTHPKIIGVIIVLAGIHQKCKNFEKSLKYFKRGTELEPKSELASLGAYLSYANLNRYDEAICELKRYLDKYSANRYKITLEELLKDLENGYGLKYKDIILKLSEKHGVG